MPTFYTAQRKRNLYRPTDSAPFRVSRSKIDLFFKCPRCFYLDRRLGIAQPSGPPFSLNSAVDTLLKKEFDTHRAAANPHPLMQAYGLDLIPFQHPRMDEWRDSLRRGIQYHHAPTNLLVTGGVDDVWVRPGGELAIVDYKATAKNGEVNLDAAWQDGYKRQMEIYQWLFRRNGFAVSNTSYFVYCNGNTDTEAFDARLEFTIKIIPYEGNDTWVEQTLIDLHACLMREDLPPPAPACDFCAYRQAVKPYELLPDA
jgi:hypothetical protein